MRKHKKKHSLWLMVTCRDPAASNLPWKEGAEKTPAPNLNGPPQFPTEALRLAANKQELKAQVVWEEEKLY